MESAAILRKHILFTGAVQGVGFRWRARHAAEAYGCTGWCRNEWDGSVEMEIQGTEAAIDAVLLAIEKGRYISIESLRVKDLPPVEREYGFHTD